MGRSVYVPSGAAAVAYVALGDDCYEDWMEELADSISAAFPSMYSCRRWSGREGCVVLANKLCDVVIAEYCGLASVSLVPNEEYGFSRAWAENALPKLRAAVSFVGEPLIKQAVFSNGEAFFQPASGVQRGAMGLGYSSKEGWL